MDAPFWNILGLWLGGFLTLCILSFLYKDNPFFQLAEKLYAGLGFGYYIGVEYNGSIKPNLLVPLYNSVVAQDIPRAIMLIIPGTLGVLLYCHYIPKINWISRIPLSLTVGFYMGIMFTMKVHGDLVGQLTNTIIPIKFLSVSSWGAFFGEINNLIILIGVFSVLTYFYFSVEQKGAIKTVSRIGIYFIMVSFGAAFGYTIMGRISLLVGRMQFLINNWAKSSPWLVIPAVIIFIILVYWTTKRRENSNKKEPTSSPIS